MIKNIIIYLISIILLASCVIYHKPPITPSSTTHAGIKKIKLTQINHDKVVNELMLYSFSLIGIPYKWGGNSRHEGFDCSGLVVHIYKNILGIDLPRTAKTLAIAGGEISKNQLKIGDLVFFNINGNEFSHVGIYVGDNKFINSPSSNGLIRVNSLNESYYLKRFSGARTFF